MDRTAILENVITVSQQFFTDDKMVGLALVFFVGMAGLGVWVWRYHDPDVIWIVAIEVMHLFILAYYYDLWRASDSRSMLELFPTTALLFRPGMVGTWAIVLTYTLSRLVRWRRHGQA